MNNEKVELNRCTRCVLPESYPGIEFNEAGVCNLCLSHTEWSYQGKEKLDEFLEPFRNKGEGYDCVVGISGGRDSSYMLYYLVKECDLRVVAYTADHGFVPEVAKSNMKHMTDILGVELVVEEHDLLKRCVKTNVSAWLRKPSPAMVPMICCGCKLGGPRGLLEFAKKNRIPLVAVGIDTPVERANLKWGFFAANPFGRRLRRSRQLSLLAGLLYELIRNPAYLAPRSMGVYVAEYLYYFNINIEGIQGLLYPDQTILNLYRYVEWNEDKILSIIKNELNWRLDPDSVWSWRFDCKMSFLKNYLYRESVGFTEKDDGLSTMIREGMITREEAMKRLEVENIIPQNKLTEVLDDIGLGDVDLSSIF